MDSNLASGDCLTMALHSEEESLVETTDERNMKNVENVAHHETKYETEMISKIIDDNEIKLKDRIAQCKNIIESLKVELTHEKDKLLLKQREDKYQQRAAMDYESNSAIHFESYPSTSNNFMEDLPDMYSMCIQSKLNCDVNLIEYEKQLLKYQNTLNMAQMEKKSAIRKKMLAKAYKLKLLEVENQCNIELLRVKQNLQCLEPLQLIVSKWETNIDDPIYNYNNWELVPRHEELNNKSESDLNTFKKDFDTQSVEDFTNFFNNDG